MTLVDRIDSLRAALLSGNTAEAARLARAIEADAPRLPAPDPRALGRALSLLQATVAGVRAAQARIARLRGAGAPSDVYDAAGRRQTHRQHAGPARRW